VQAAAHAGKADLRLRAASGLEDTAGQASGQSNLVAALSHVPDGPPDREHRLAGGSGRGSRPRHQDFTYIGTDTEAAGELAAGTMGTLVGRGDRVSVIAGISG
jgi:hypothetical protein